MAETTPGAPAVKPIVMNAAKKRLQTGAPQSRLAQAHLGARPKREQSQVTVAAPTAKY